MAVEFKTGCGDGDDDGMERMTAIARVGQIDQSIRQAIYLGWLALPKEKQTFDEVERQIRTLVDRAIRDFREDSEAFGHSG